MKSTACNALWPLLAVFPELGGSQDILGYQSLATPELNESQDSLRRGLRSIAQPSSSPQACRPLDGSCPSGGKGRLSLAASVLVAGLTKMHFKVVVFHSMINFSSYMYFYNWLIPHNV